MQKKNSLVNIHNPDNSLRDVGDVVREIHGLGYHCSETLVRALWPYLLPDEELTDTILKMTMVLHGGIGDSMGSHCGGMTAPILLIGAKYGREDINGDARYAPAIARGFWQRFVDEFGTTHCTTLKQDRPPGPEAPTRCGCIMVRSARLLLDYLQELEANRPDKEEMYLWRLDRSQEPCHEHTPVMKSSEEVKAELAKKKNRTE